jgi:hypothetical protein
MSLSEQDCSAQDSAFAQGAGRFGRCSDRDVTPDAAEFAQGCTSQGVLGSALMLLFASTCSSYGIWAVCERVGDGRAVDTRVRLGNICKTLFGRLSVARLVRSGFLAMEMC